MEARAVAEPQMPRLMLTPEGVPAVIKQWRKKQDMFDDYKVKPLSIHVLLQNRVWCLNLTTEEISEPEPRDKGVPKAFS